MANYNKYQRLKKQYSYDGVHWQDVVPAEYKPGEIIEENSTDCGAIDPQYRWYNADPSVDYICSGYNKFYKQYYQVSYDGGTTWENVQPIETQIGEIAEPNSFDCDYGVSWEIVDNQFICGKALGEYYYIVKPSDSESTSDIYPISIIDIWLIDSENRQKCVRPNVKYLVTEEGDFGEFVSHETNGIKFTNANLHKANTWYLCLDEENPFTIVDSIFPTSNASSTTSGLYPNNYIGESQGIADLYNTRYYIKYTTSNGFDDIDYDSNFKLENYHNNKQFLQMFQGMIMFDANNISVNVSLQAYPYVTTQRDDYIDANIGLIYIKNDDNVEYEFDFTTQADRYNLTFDSIGFNGIHTETIADLNSFINKLPNGYTYALKDLYCEETITDITQIPQAFYTILDGMTLYNTKRINYLRYINTSVLQQLYNNYKSLYYYENIYIDGDIDFTLDANTITTNQYWYSTFYTKNTKNIKISNMPDISGFYTNTFEVIAENTTDVIENIELNNCKVFPNLSNYKTVEKATIINCPMYDLNYTPQELVIEDSTITKHDDGISTKKVNIKDCTISIQSDISYFEIYPQYDTSEFTLENVVINGTKTFSSLSTFKGKLILKNCPQNTVNFYNNLIEEAGSSSTFELVVE